MAEKKKATAFNEARPRTPKAEARQREIAARKAMEELLELRDDDKCKLFLAARFGIGPGDPRYQKVMAIWREH
jgi:hypothetical protein